MAKFDQRCLIMTDNHSWWLIARLNSWNATGSAIGAIRNCCSPALAPSYMGRFQIPKPCDLNIGMLNSQNFRIPHLRHYFRGIGNCVVLNFQVGYFWIVPRWNLSRNSSICEKMRSRNSAAIFALLLAGACYHCARPKVAEPYAGIKTAHPVN